MEVEDVEVRCTDPKFNFFVKFGRNVHKREVGKGNGCCVLTAAEVKGYHEVVHVSQTFEVELDECAFVVFLAF